MKTRNYCYQLLIALLATVSCLTARAIPADPTPVQVMQPDGSTLTIKQHGDEFIHHTATTDGYTVLKNATGYYVYAQLDNGLLVPSQHVAHDMTERTASEQALLASTPRHLTSSDMRQAGVQLLARRNSTLRRIGANGHMDYDRFRGLIVLVNFNDQEFSMSNAQGFYNDMVNTRGYTGYDNDTGRVACPGSVRDYFCDNSMGVFDPVFDVVGPVTVPYSCTYPQTVGSDSVFYAALDAIDDMVDFSAYDSDDNGEVDMVFFMVAGYSSSYAGNNSGYLWPHMYELTNAPQHDGMKFGLYACSTEMYGWEGFYHDVSGIGTFCHEFSHVLGLPDLYDVDYSGSGGTSHDPGTWDVMASGNNANVGRNPVGYSLYERYALGFATPVLIDATGSYTLQDLATSNQGYRLNSPVENEYFLLESRQQTGWDEHLPGSGMLVVRVDSTSQQPWTSNKVNVNPQHNYYELLRAGGSTSGDNGSDAFPGTAGVTELSNFTTPSLLTWSGEYNEFAIQDIQATGDGQVTFTVVSSPTSIASVVEDFENMPVTTEKNAKGVQGVYCQWNFTKCMVNEPGEGNCNGKRAVKMTKPSRITTATALDMTAVKASYTVFNPTSTTAQYQLDYSQDGGTSWTTPADGTMNVAAGETQTCTAMLPGTASLMLRVSLVSGSTSEACYLDDIVIHYASSAITGDVNGDGEVTIADVNAVIDLILSGAYEAAADVNNDGEVTIADVNAVIDIILSQG